MNVSSRGEQAVQALSRFGELAWFKLPKEFNAVYVYAQVPYMGWRYAFPEEGVAQLIEAAVRALPTQVDWEIDRTRRSWARRGSCVRRTGSPTPASETLFTLSTFKIKSFASKCCQISNSSSSTCCRCTSHKTEAVSFPDLILGWSVAGAAPADGLPRR
jgi:hypothetical protein